MFESQDPPETPGALRNGLLGGPGLIEEPRRHDLAARDDTEFHRHETPPARQAHPPRPEDHTLEEDRGSIGRLFRTAVSDQAPVPGRDVQQDGTRRAQPRRRQTPRGHRSDAGHDADRIPSRDPPSERVRPGRPHARDANPEPGRAARARGRSTDATGPWALVLKKRGRNPRKGFRPKPLGSSVPWIRIVSPPAPEPPRGAAARLRSPVLSRVRVHQENDER